jgi:hypothetical protein
VDYRFELPADRLAAMTRSYVRYAAANRPLFEVLVGTELDKTLHPEIEAAARPLNEAFLACARARPRGDHSSPDDLATAIDAVAHGHALLLHHGDFGHGEEAVEVAADRAARATLALVESRHLLDRPAHAQARSPHPPTGRTVRD